MAAAAMAAYSAAVIDGGIEGIIRRKGGETTRRGLCEQQRLTVIQPVVTLVVDVVGRRRHGQQHGVMIRRTLQLPASSCGVGTGQEESTKKMFGAE